MAMSTDQRPYDNVVDLSDSVVLTPAVANRIVHRVSEGLATNASVTRRPGVIVASSEPSLVGSNAPAAVAVLDGASATSAAAASDSALACPLVYDDEIVGALVLHGDLAQLTSSMRLAKTLAELLIHQATVIDQLGSLEHRRSSFVADLLLGRLTGLREASRAATLVGIDLSIPRVAVALRVDSLMHEAQSPRPTESLPSIFRDWRARRARTRLVEWVLPRTLCGPDDICSVVDSGWLALLTRIAPDGSPDDHRDVKRRIAPLMQELAKSGETSLCAGVGHSYPGATGLAASFAEARFVATAGCRLLGPAQVATIEELGLAGLVGDSGSGVKDRLVDQILAALTTEPDLLETTRVFFSHDLSPATTAAALQIHRHTLAYRLDKVRRLTGLDPRRFREAAQLHAALLMRQLGPDASA